MIANGATIYIFIYTKDIYNRRAQWTKNTQQAPQKKTVNTQHLHLTSIRGKSLSIQTHAHTYTHNLCDMEEFLCVRMCIVWLGMGNNIFLFLNNKVLAQTEMAII